MRSPYEIISADPEDPPIIIRAPFFCSRIWKRFGIFISLSRFTTFRRIRIMFAIHFYLVWNIKFPPPTHFPRVSKHISSLIGFPLLTHLFSAGLLSGLCKPGGRPLLSLSPNCTLTAEFIFPATHFPISPTYVWMRAGVFDNLTPSSLSDSIFFPDLPIISTPPEARGQRLLIWLRPCF